MNSRSILIITPVRNEADFLPRVIESMISQTVRPREWVIVDDGSTDGTANVIQRFAAKHPWIHYVYKSDRGHRSVGPGVVEAFNYGFMRKNIQDYDYIAKMDGDITFPDVYLETILDYFEKDPVLGSASGKIVLEAEEGKFVEERTADEMVVGAFNFYRRQAFQDIGGFAPIVMWDGIAYHRARMSGWRTRSINDKRLLLVHKRLMGSSEKSIYHGRLRWGRGQYTMGTHPLYILAVSAYRLFERPYIIGGILILSGYISAAFKGLKRYGDKDFRRSLHAWQMERLGLGKRLESLPTLPGSSEDQKRISPDAGTAASGKEADSSPAAPSSPSGAVA